MANRVYVVEKANSTEKRLVRAANRHTAFQHVARGEYSAHLASKDELVSLITGGLRVEDASDAHAAEQQAE